MTLVEMALDLEKESGRTGLRIKHKQNGCGTLPIWINILSMLLFGNSIIIQSFHQLMSTGLSGFKQQQLKNFIGERPRCLWIC